MEDRLHVDASTPPLRATAPTADGLHGFAAAAPDLAWRARGDELRDLDRRKDTFVSAVSHQLRGPLTMVRGAAEMLSDQRGSLSSDEVADLEQLILEQCQRLATVLDELLDVDRMVRGKLTTDQRPTELISLVKRVIARPTARWR